MPLADSVLWSPAIGGAQRPAPLMFFAQPTLRKIHDRLATVPNGRGIGLLAGRRYTDARSGSQFVMIDGALPLPALAAEDEATDALAQGMASAAAGIEIVGWYRSHSFSVAALSSSDVEAQSELFGDRAPIVVVVAAGGDVGAVFRQSSSPAWPVEVLPLYEWLSEPAKTDGAGSRHTTLNWRNYHSSEPVTRVGNAVGAPAPAPAPAPALTPGQERVTPQTVLFPQAEDDDDDDDESPPAVAPAWAVGYKRFLKPAIYVASALGGAALVAGLSAIISSGDASSGSRGAGSNGNGAAGEPGTAAYAAALLDRRADTLALALTSFEDRIRMFDARQMTCPGLARGLQQVEETWLAYNLARRETLAPFDAQREERDRTLYSDIRTVERRFERSGCARP